MGGIYDLPVEDLGDIDRAILEDVPVGVVRIDEAGTILAFTRRESERFGRRSVDVIGRLFFEDVAPCTSVQEFRGRFDQMVQARVSSHAELDFVFCYNEASQQVRIVLVWNAVREVGHVLISMPKD
jgi:photoactive yellow protein